MTKADTPSPKSTTPKVFDVFRPGKTQASPTSRPVIVSHKPSVQDTTVTDKPSKQIVGEPMYHHMMDSHDKVEVAVPVDEKTPKLKFEPDDDTANDLTDENVQPQDTAADTPSTDTINKAHEHVEVTEVASEAGEIAMTHDAVVAFHEPNKGKRALKVLGLLVAAIVFFVVICDVLLDTGVVKPDTHVPHTHFFNQ